MTVLQSRESKLAKHWGNFGKQSQRLGGTYKDERMMKMAMKRKTLFGMFDIRLSQLTCKIFKTGTNANSADLLAPKNPQGFTNELTLTMVGCPEQGEYTVWALNGTMCESQTGSCEVKAQDPPGCPLLS